MDLWRERLRAAAVGACLVGLAWWASCIPEMMR